MPQEMKQVPITFGNTGIVLRNIPDELPLTGYKALVNVVTDRENSISVRKGFSRLNGGLSTGPHSLFFLRDGDGRQWRYAIANREWWVAPVIDPNDEDVWPVALGTDFSEIPGGGSLSDDTDPRAFFANYTLSGFESKPYVFMADGKKFLKHPGGKAAGRRIGIPAPTEAVTVLTLANAYTRIADFEDHDAWTANDATLDAVANGIRDDSQGVSFTIASGTKVGYATITMIDPNNYPNEYVMELGNNDRSEAIEFWFQFPTEADALNVKEIVISFGLSLVAGDDSFSTCYEKAVATSALTAAAQPSSDTGYVDSVDGAQTTYGYTQSKYRSPDYSDSAYAESYPETNQDAFNDYSLGQPKTMQAGVGVWQGYRIRKDDFGRVGTKEADHPELNWDTVTAMRVTVRLVDSPSADGTVYLDDCSVLTTGKLFGENLIWAYTYYNSATNTESDLSPVAATPYNAPAEYAQFQIVFPQTAATDAPAAAPDYIRLYRMGGTVQQFQLVDSIPYVGTLGDTTIPDPYDDNIPDSLLGDLADLDNQLPPDEVRGVELFDNRLWTWGGSMIATGLDGYPVEIPEPPNRLRFSKNVDVEHFPAANYIYVGTGSEKIQRVKEHDGELLVFTLTQVYRVVGSAGNYRAVSTAVNQGLKNPFGLAKGTRALFMQAYDGIYEFPSGRKISEPINQIFFGEIDLSIVPAPPQPLVKTTNEIPPIYPGRESEGCMGFWDNKLYFSYCSTSDPSTTPDCTLVWDTIYERWHWYLYGCSCLFTEPENNFLVGGELYEWEGIVDNRPYNAAYGGIWPLHLEDGYVDQLSEPVGNRGIFWALDTREYDLGMPDQEKRFIDIVVDADTQGTPITVQMGFDLTGEEAKTAAHEPIGICRTNGRERTVLPILLGEGDSKLATRASIRILARQAVDATSSIRLYKVVHRFFIEPPRHKTFVTDWSDQGKPGPKFFRELWIEMDTFGLDLESIEVQIDQAVAQVLTQGLNADGQTKIYYGLHPDIRGTLARLKVVPFADNEVKVYDYEFQVIPEPPCINTLQLPWQDNGFPFRKLWKHVQIDIDTENRPVQFYFWLDGVIVQEFTVRTEKRLRFLQSFDRDLFGKLGRLTVDESFLDPECCLPLCFRYYGESFATDQMVPDTTISDSWEQVMSFDRLKVLRRLWVAMLNPDGDVNLDVYVDNELRMNLTIPMEQVFVRSFTKRRLDFKAGLKGRLFRFVFTSPFAFELHWEKSDIELKDVNTEDGYRKEKMMPPQTY
jgi:hypothetical protein